MDVFCVFLKRFLIGGLNLQRDRCQFSIKKKYIYICYQQTDYSKQGSSALRSRDFRITGSIQREGEMLERGFKD